MPAEGEYMKKVNMMLASGLMMALVLTSLTGCQKAESSAETSPAESSESPELSQEESVTVAPVVTEELVESSEESPEESSEEVVTPEVTEAPESSDTSEADGTEGSLPEGFAYQMAVIAYEAPTDSDQGFLSLAITTNAGALTLNDHALQNEKGESIASAEDGYTYYTGSGEDSWKEVLAELCTEIGQDAIPFNMSYLSNTDMLFRFSLEEEVDPTKVVLHIDSLNADPAKEGNGTQVFENVDLTVNAELSDMTLCDSPSLSNGILSSDGHYYMVQNNGFGSASGEEEIDGTSYEYESHSTWFACLSTDSEGLKRARFHLIDVRTMEDIVLPENVYPYLGGTYQASGNVPREEDMRINWGLCAEEDYVDDMEEAWDDLMDYAAFGYETDDGLQVIIR